MERIEAGREAIVFILEGFYVLVSQIAADEQLLADGQFQSGTVEKRTGELIAEVEEMRTATEDGIEQFVLEAGCKVQFRGVAAENIICTLVSGLALTSPSWKPSSFSL